MATCDTHCECVTQIRHHKLLLSSFQTASSTIGPINQFTTASHQSTPPPPTRPPTPSPVTPLHFFLSLCPAGTASRPFATAQQTRTLDLSGLRAAGTRGLKEEMGRTYWRTDGQPGCVGASEGGRDGPLYDHFFLLSDPTRPASCPSVRGARVKVPASECD